MWQTLLTVLICLNLFNPSIPEKTSAEQRMKHMYEQVSQQTHIPWIYLAAMNQYEKNIHNKQSSRQTVYIHVPQALWSGYWNPNRHDNNPQTIAFFHGIGRDGNHDGKADLDNEQDILYSIGHYLAEQGTGEDQIRHQLWLYYQHPVSIDVITHIAKIYQRFQRLNLDEYRFPIPNRYHYTYRSTWGASRGWGGRRIHEGTDIYANYGTPVVSTCYGYIELVGWNRYGGWRIGIRDIKNRYHYFAHLQSFRPNLRQGTIVQPGELLGYVGSSGYGKPGTAGKFPPHLHYGLYRFTGKNTFAFDPYPLLQKWEEKRNKPHP